MSLTGTVDSDSSSSNFNLSSFGILQPQNNLLQNLYLVNSFNQPLAITAGGIQTSISDIGIYGKFLGVTLTSLSPDFILVFLAIAYQYLTMAG